MKKVKIILTIMLTLAILLTHNMAVEASQTNSPISQSERILLIDVLSEIEPQKSAWGLENIDFGELNIGLPIQTYNYIDGEFESSHIMYPLTVGSQLVLWAIPIGEQFQITNALVPEISTSIDSVSPFAVVYDSSSVYVYSEQSFELLRHFDQIIESRDVLNTKARHAVQEIETASLSQSTSLDYESNIQNMQRSTPVNFSCNVSFVTQQPGTYKKLCWAASVACIVNYVKDMSLDAVTVAKKYYGDDFDQGIDRDDLTEKIKGYGLKYYQPCDDKNFDNKILNSILADNPVGGSFDVVNGNYHAAVIFGINIIAGRIQVMDPEFGMTTASLVPDDGYTYVSSYSNATLILYAISYDTGN